jgi:hypothetical protein
MSNILSFREYTNEEFQTSFYVRKKRGIGKDYVEVYKNPSSREMLDVPSKPYYRFLIDKEYNVLLFRVDVLHDDVLFTTDIPINEKFRGILNMKEKELLLYINVNPNKLIEELIKSRWIRRNTKGFIVKNESTFKKIGIIP